MILNPKNGKKYNFLHFIIVKTHVFKIKKINNFVTQKRQQFMKKTTIILTFATLFLVACSSGDTNKTEASTEETATIETATSEVPTEESSIAEIAVPTDINDLLTKNTCLTCHNANEKLVGPAYVEIAKRDYTAEQIVELIYKPKPSNWPDYQTPMIGLPNVPKDEALKIANWIISLK
jgi:cytochrome c551/c552